MLIIKVLGKEEGDKQDNNKKNWHGHVTVIPKNINKWKWKLNKGDNGCTWKQETGSGEIFDELPGKHFHKDWLLFRWLICQIDK